MDKIINELYRIFKELNKQIFNGELPETTIITVQTKGKLNGVLGWCTSRPIWANKESEKLEFEINLTAEYLNREYSEIVATLLHEMVHLEAGVKKIKDTSRQGRYHNKAFKKLAESRQLTVEYDNKLGYAITGLNEKSKAISDKLETEGKAIIRNYRIPTVKKPTKKRITYKYICPDCGITATTNKEAKLICQDCNHQMINKDEF